MPFAPPPPFPELGGRYVLGRQLGRGGMAEVWAAEDKLLGVLRAVKILAPDTRTRRSLQRRLQAEARAMAQIAHPNVLRVYDVGSVAGHDYVVMDLAPGGSVSEQIGQEGVGVHDACRWTLQMLGALGAAHARGIIHRDVKPSNLLLDANGDALLSDFGIARFQEQAFSHTRSGIAMGTLMFMAPEQRIDARNVGPEADLYAAGASLYHLLTGETPVDLFAAAPDSARWREVPPAFVPFLQRATRHDPAARFPDAATMAAALAEIVATLPADATPVARRRRVGPAGPGTPTVPLRGPLLGERTRLATATGVEAALQTVPRAASRSRLPLVIAVLSGFLFVIGAVALWPSGPPAAAEPPPRVIAQVVPPSPPAPSPPAPSTAAPVETRGAPGIAAAAAPPRPKRARSAVAGRYTGVFNRMLDAELALDGPDDAITGAFVTRAGERVGTPREFRSPVRGRYDPSTRALTLEDVNDDATAGGYALVLSADGARLDGTFQARHRDQRVDFSLRKP